MKNKKIAIVGCNPTILTAAVTAILASKGVRESDLHLVEFEDDKKGLEEIAEKFKYEPKKLYIDTTTTKEENNKHPFQKYMGNRRKNW